METGNKHTFEDLVEALTGRWKFVLWDLAPELRTAIERAPQHVPCPMHGGHDGLRLFRDYEETGGAICNTCGAFRNGFLLLEKVLGVERSEAVRLVADWAGMAYGRARPVTLPPRTPAKPRALAEAEITSRRKYLGRLWEEAYPADSGKAKLLRDYLNGRGLQLPKWPNALRLHPGLLYYEDRNSPEEAVEPMGPFPALLTKISDADGSPIGLHRTYLDPHGAKAMVSRPKKLLPAAAPHEYRGGAAVRLTRPGRLLCLGEGVETMLAVLQVLGLPTWACLSTSLLERVAIPESVEEVWIFADKDRKEAGQNSAQVLHDAVCEQGRRARIWLPPGELAEGAKSLDWLDVLNAGNLNAFPRHEERTPPLAATG